MVFIASDALRHLALTVLGLVLLTMHCTYCSTGHWNGCFDAGMAKSGAGMASDRIPLRYIVGAVCTL